MGRDADKINLITDEFDEESLSDTDLEKVELHTLKIRRTKFSTFGSFSQVIVFLMLWCVVLGTTMMALHLVSQKDPRWHTIMQIGLSIAWMSLANLSAIIFFTVDKFLAVHEQPRLSEALIQCQFMIGGVVGGWLTLCLTCYRPANVTADKSHIFILRTMFSTTIGIAIDIFLILRIMLPLMHQMV